MKIRDNETGEIFEYGTNIHHALRISRNGGCLIFENLQNGDGSLENGDGGYSFVLDDGTTPKESDSPDAINYATYANIGGFHGDTAKNDGWIPVEEHPKKDYTAVFAVDKHDYYFVAVYDKEHGYRTNDVGADVDNIVAYCLFNPYRPERSEE